MSDSFHPPSPATEDAEPRYNHSDHNLSEAPTDSLFHPPNQDDPPNVEATHDLLEAPTNLVIDQESPNDSVDGDFSSAAPIKDVIAAASDHLFKIGFVYDSLNELKSCAEKFAKEYHFEVRYGGKKIHCYRGYQSTHERDRDTIRQSLEIRIGTA